MRQKKEGNRKEEAKIDVVRPILAIDDFRMFDIDIQSALSSRTKHNQLIFCDKKH